MATLLAERSPESVRSAVAACAPIGNFRLQVNYIGDFRVLFDYFFPGIIPGSAIHIPPPVIAQWESFYVPYIAAALQANPERALELMRVSKAAFDPSNLATVITTTINVLRYNILGANDAAQKLGGNPFGNRQTLYVGSSNDLRLNLLVHRFVASPLALQEMQLYETSGDLSVPLVTLHTTRGRGSCRSGTSCSTCRRSSYPGADSSCRCRCNRYGHCNFTTNELLGSFALAISLP